MECNLKYIKKKQASEKEIKTQFNAESKLDIFCGSS